MPPRRHQRPPERSGAIERRCLALVRVILLASTRRFVRIFGPTDKCRDFGRTQSHGEQRVKQSVVGSAT